MLQSFLLFILAQLQIADCHVITPAPALPTTHLGLPSIPGQAFPAAHARAVRRDDGDDDEALHTDCDGQGILFCPVGTCYSGHDGFIGCCSVSSCAPRTTCVNYNDDQSSKCDINTGGCLACSEEAPSCVTFSNVLEDQYAYYCDTREAVVTTSYTNLLMDYGSMAPVSRTSTSTTKTSSERESSSTSVSAQSAANDSSDEETEPDDAGLSTGAAVGVAVGGAVAGIALLFIIWWFAVRPWLRRRKAAAAGNAGGEYSVANEKWDEDGGPGGSKGLGISEMDSTQASSEHPFGRHSHVPSLTVSELGSDPASSPKHISAQTNSYPGQPQYLSPSAAGSPAGGSSSSPSNTPRTPSFVPAPAVDQTQGSRDPRANVTYVPFTPNLTRESGNTAPAGEGQSIRQVGSAASLMQPLESTSASNLSARSAGPAYPTAESAMTGGMLFGEVQELEANERVSK